MRLLIRLFSSNSASFSGNYSIAAAGDSDALTIYGPHQNPVTGAQSYTAVARRFSEVSLWDDFLGFHYTGRAFEPATQNLVVPDRAISAPGAAQ